MADTPSPREVFHRLLDGITSRNFDGLHTLYAEDTVVEHTFGVPTPTRWVGREQIRQHFAMASETAPEFEARNVVVHESTDPEVIVAEWDYHGTSSTGEDFRMGNVLVMRVRDGRIVSSRDYHDHLAIAAATGRIPQLVSALSTSGPGTQARDTVERARRLVIERDTNGFADLFAVEGTLEWMSAPPGMPRLLRGREEIRRVLTAAVERNRQSGLRPTGYHSEVVHETADPEVLVVEFELGGEQRDGEAFSVPGIQVFTVRGGEIVSLRDYFRDYVAEGTADAIKTATS